MELKEIDKKWQKKWKETWIYKVKENLKKKKFYVLDMFPYPSWAWLHVGHPKWYIASDTLARKKMLEGFNVLHPMGFDTFGLWTENYAIENKIKPQNAAKENIATFVKQLEMFGTTYDRSRIVNTADPKYFKRTQRIFLKLYNHYYDEREKKAKPIKDLIKKLKDEKKSKKEIEQIIESERLAYVDYKPINRCPSCMTWLANEDLDDGKCERCGSEVEQKPMKQRVLRITKYAERLIQWLDNLSREESMKELERNWIGKSEWTQFKMSIENSDKYFEVYTTRIDTVFGMSFVVMAPEHPLLKEMMNYELWIKNWKEINEYIEKAKYKTQLERTELQKEKTGVKIEWIYAINPFNNQKIPIYIWDYVLANYGTGVVMAVPAHDQRDFEFAKKYNLPIKQVIMPDSFDPKNMPRDGKENTERNTVHVILRHPENKTVLVQFLKHESWEHLTPKNFIIGGIEGDESEINAAKREIEEETWYTNVKFVEKIPFEIQANFFAAHKDVNRKIHVSTLVFDLISDERVEITEDDFFTKDSHEAHWIPYEKVAETINIVDDEMSWKYFYEWWFAYTEKWILINSPVKNFDKTVLILHGTEGDSKKNRYPRLQNQLQKLWYSVIVPDMPNSNYPELNVWLDNLDQYKDQINEQSIIIWHSLGAPTAIQFLQKYNKKIDRLILVAPTHPDIDRDEYNKRVPSYNNDNIQKVATTLTDWAKIKLLVKYVDVFLSEDDPYIPIAVKWFYERDLWAKSIIFKDKWHFNLAGLKSEKFPEPLKLIEDLYPINKAVSFNGMTSEEAIDKMNERLETKWLWWKRINYKMQDRVFSRQRYRGEPFPVLRTEVESWKLKVESKIIPLSPKDLPVTLPDVENYAPTGTEEWPLANIQNRVNVTLADWTVAKRETNTMPGWAWSSRYWLRYMDPNNDKRLVDPKKEKYWQNVDVYIWWAEHVTRHMIYARFWQKFLFDIGVISNDEPFQEYHYVWLIMWEDGRKMSKRRDNVVNPDEIINEYGADSLRTYEMFMGPFDQSIARNTNGIKWVKKFLDKIIILSDKVSTTAVAGQNEWQSSKETKIILNQTIKKIWEDMDGFKFNTAVSQLMIFVNHLSELDLGPVKEKISHDVFEKLIILISPFAPHLAEELREKIWNKYSIFTKWKWPSYDEKYLVADEMTLPVQFNGKMRWTISIDKNAEEMEVMTKIKSDLKLSTYLIWEIKKVIYVKWKIVNIIL